MHPSQAINPDNALIYASFDRMWVESVEGWTVAGNNGGAATPDYIYMGPGTSQPRQITEERGIDLSGGQYAFTRLSFDAGTPFSIAVLSDSAMAAAGWLAATFDSSTNLGVRFGASAAGTLVAELRNAGGSIVQTAALPSNAGRAKRLYILTYDGSGTTGGLKIHVDDRTLASVASGTTVAGSLGTENLMIGCQRAGGGPAVGLVGKIFGVAVYRFELNEAMRLTLRGRMLRETKASAPAVYGAFQAAQIWTLADIPDLYAWWRSDAGVTVVDDAGTPRVSEISDQSGPGGLGVPLTQGTIASRPIYEPNGWLDGGPSITFNGTSSNLRADAVAPSFSNAPPFSVIAMMHAITVVSDRMILGIEGVATWSLLDPMRFSSTSYWPIIRDDALVLKQVTGTAFDKTIPHVCSSIWSGGRVTVIANGSTIINDIDVSVGNATFGYLMLGGRHKNAQYTNFRFAEMLIVGRAISPAEEAKIRLNMIARRTI